MVCTMKTPGLAPDAKYWHQLWSLRLAIAAAALSAMEVVMPLVQHMIPNGVFGTLAGIVGVGAAIARVVNQQLR